MVFRFSKSFRLGPARANLSKRGIGMSLGAKGVRVGTGRRGTYASVSVPGTGISHRISLGSGGGRSGTRDPVDQGPAARIVLRSLGIAVLATTELIVLAVSPPVGALLMAGTIGLFAWSRWRRSKDPKFLYRNKGKEVVQHVNAGQWERALQALEECDRIMPGKRETLGLKGQVLFQLTRFNEAISCLEAGLNNEAETLMLAEALRHTGRYRASIEVLKTPPLDEALAVQALAIRAANHLELDEPDTAIDILKTAPLRKRNLDEDLKRVHFVMAKAYEKAGRQADAVKHLRRIYAVDPGFMDVASELERLTKPSDA